MNKKTHNKNTPSIGALMLGVGIFFLAFSFFAPAVAADERLDTAVELWLEGDDAQSLPMLAELAAEGNAQARLLLGRIETSDLGPSPFRLSLTAKEARALFRQPDINAVGRSWLAVEARAGNELALALQRSRRPEPDLDLIARLNQLGEHQATDYPTRIAALYGGSDMRRALLSDAQVMQDLKPYLRYLSGPAEPRGDGLAALRHIQPAEVSAEAADALEMAEFLALGLGFGDSSPSNPWRPAVERWLGSAPSAAPIANLCETSCAGDVAACSFAFLALSGGYYEIIRIDSPLEAAIPQETFLNSPRARLMVLRRAVLARTETNLSWLSETKEAAKLSACAIDLVRQERQKYP